MTDASDQNPSQSSFELQDAQTAFDKFSTAEIERLHQTDPEFNAELYERARRLVLSQLEALSGSETA